VLRRPIETTALIRTWGQTLHGFTSVRGPAHAHVREILLSCNKEPQGYPKVGPVSAGALN
jgi:hypothetical protein